MNRQRIIAAVATVLIHVGIVLVLLWICLDYPGSAEEQNREWPPVDSSLLLFGGEYVNVGIPEAEVQPETPQESQAEVESEQAQDRTEPQEAELTSSQPSPAKAPDVKKNNEKEQKQKELRDAENAQKRREESQKREITAKVGNAFAGASGKGEKATKGQANGNSNHGNPEGTPGCNLTGRTLEHFQLPPSGPVGSITVTIRVNREGRVVAVTSVTGTGAAGASEKARKNCQAAAKASQFSVNLNAPESQTGTITYVFR